MKIHLAIQSSNILNWGDFGGTFENLTIITVFLINLGGFNGLLKSELYFIKKIII